MSQAQMKNAALFAGGVILTMLVFNSLASRVATVAAVKKKVDAGV
jgi:hypothetical protein